VSSSLLPSLSPPPWSCGRCCSRDGAHLVVIAIATTVGEALQTENAAPFPAEGAAGLELAGVAEEVTTAEPEALSQRQRLRRGADPRCRRRERVGQSRRRERRVDVVAIAIAVVVIVVGGCVRMRWANAGGNLRGQMCGPFR